MKYVEKKIKQRMFHSIKNIDEPYVGKLLFLTHRNSLSLIQSNYKSDTFMHIIDVDFILHTYLPIWCK